MVSTNNIVILGGSYGGVSSAHYILKHVLPALPTTTLFQVILISTSSEILCRPACPRAMIPDELFPQEKLFVSIPEVFAQYPAQSFSFEKGTAARLDHSNRTISVRSSDGHTEKTIDFFALVIATGASTSSPLFGLNHDSDFLRKKKWAAFREALATAKRVVIAGGGRNCGRTRRVLERSGRLVQSQNGESQSAHHSCHLGSADSPSPPAQHRSEGRELPCSRWSDCRQKHKGHVCRAR
jgi:NADH dehydrogenase FAD-containing subunit